MFLVSCVVLFLLCVCVCDLFLFLQEARRPLPCLAASTVTIGLPVVFFFCFTSYANFGAATHPGVGGGTHRRRATFERC